MRSKLFVLTLIVLCFVTNSYGQKNILPAYVISLAGDTIYGQMDYRIWEQNPSSIDFIKDGEETKYRANEILGFSVANNHFKGAIVENSISSNDMNSLEASSKLKLKVDTTFLQLLLEGEKNLYTLTNSFGIQNFYIESDEVITLLEYKKYLIQYPDGRSDQVAYNKKFIGQLTVLLGDCPEIVKILESITYTETSLKKAFLKYYTCTGSSATLTEGNDWKTSVGVIGGITLTGVNFDDTKDVNLIGANLPKSTDVTFGISYVMEKPSSKWSISNNLIYSSYLIEGTSVSTNGVFVTTSNISFGMNQIRIITMPRYAVLNFNKTKVFLSGGACWGVTIGNTNDISYSTSIVNTTTVTSSGRRDALKAINKTEFGFLGGAGVKHDRLSAEVRFESTNGSANFARTIRQYFVIGYSF